MAAIARKITKSRVASNGDKGTNPNAPKKTSVTPVGRKTTGRS